MRVDDLGAVQSAAKMKGATQRNRCEAFLARAPHQRGIRRTRHALRMPASPEPARQRYESLLTAAKRALGIDVNDGKRFGDISHRLAYFRPAELVAAGSRTKVVCLPADVFME
jgi:hypothetical protein